jgi:hypothetical protein
MRDYFAGVRGSSKEWRYEAEEAKESEEVIFV